jgi:hypothetical protein
MKDRALTILSLTIAIAALAHSVWLQQRAHGLARDALRERESEIVRAAAPQMARVYRDMMGQEADATTFQPTTLEELGRPLIRIITNMAGAGQERPTPKSK